MNDLKEDQFHKSQLSNRRSTRKKAKKKGSIMKSAEIMKRQDSQPKFNQNSLQDNVFNENDKFSKNHLKIVSRFDLMKSNSLTNSENNSKRNNKPSLKNKAKMTLKQSKLKTKLADNSLSPFSRQVPLKMKNAKIFSFQKPQLFFEKIDKNKKYKTKASNVYRDSIDKKQDRRKFTNPLPERPI